MSEYLYLDNNATTRPLECVIEALARTAREAYANPSSPHRFGQRIRHQVETAREQVAGLVGADAREIVFTSGGTESINLAIMGLLGAGGGQSHLIVSAVEHSSVLRLARRLAHRGCRVDEIGVDRAGRLNLTELEEKVRPDTTLVSIMHANNETGVIFDVERVCAIADRAGVPVHLDAVQSVGKLAIDVGRLPVHLLSLSAHKLHGPKGVGALYIRKHTRLTPPLVGGNQERGLRPGTENVPAIVGFGVAAEGAARLPADTHARIRALRDDLEARLVMAIPFAHVIGADAERLGNTSSIGFEHLASEALLILLSEKGICAAAGAACASGSLDPSHVLIAMRVDPLVAHGAVRLSLSRFTTAAEIDRTVEVLTAAVERLSATVV